MPYLDRWIIGFLVGIVGVAALYVASEASGSFMYVTGILFFLAAVLFNFFMINQAFQKKKSK